MQSSSTENLVTYRDITQMNAQDLATTFIEAGKVLADYESFSDAVNDAKSDAHKVGEVGKGLIGYD